MLLQEVVNVLGGYASVCKERRELRGIIDAMQTVLCRFIHFDATSLSKIVVHSLKSVTFVSTNRNSRSSFNSRGV